MNERRESGISDKNGRIIHEGDMLRAKYDYLYIVYFDVSSGVWMARDPDDTRKVRLETVAPYGEVEDTRI
jgi:hypothetical protein